MAGHIYTPPRNRVKRGSFPNQNSTHMNALSSLAAALGFGSNPAPLPGDAHNIPQPKDVDAVIRKIARASRRSPRVSHDTHRGGAFGGRRKHNGIKFRKNLGLSGIYR